MIFNRVDKLLKKMFAVEIKQLASLGYRENQILSLIKDRRKNFHWNDLSSVEEAEIRRELNQQIDFAKKSLNIYR